MIGLNPSAPVGSGTGDPFLVWIDNDGCPRMVRDLVIEATARRSLSVMIVGNSNPSLPRGATNVRPVVVPGGFDAADDYIADHCKLGDLVITADVPLAGRIVKSGATGLSPRGEEFNDRTIGDQLSSRNLMQELRGGGMIPGGGPAPLGQADKKRFADALDRLLTRLSRR